MLNDPLQYQVDLNVGISDHLSSRLKIVGSPTVIKNYGKLLFCHVLTIARLFVVFTF